MAEQDKSTNSPTATCRVFISYSHDSTEHEQRVRALADQLREDGIDARIDQYVQDPDEGWIKWMRSQVKEAEKALLVFTETYQRRFEGDEEEGKGLGATFEGVIVTQSLYESGGRNAKFRPVVFRDEDAQFIPVELRRFNRYRVDTPEHYQNLLRWLYEAPRIIPPRLGQKANLPPDGSLKLFASKSDKPPVSAPASPPGSAQGAAGPEPAPLGISKTVEIAEGVLTFGSGSWRMSVLLPPFLDKPEITLVPEGWSADKDPVIEEISTDKFTAKISSSTQQGKWIWRASGALLKTHSADAATTSGIGIVEGVLTFGSGSWRMSVLLPPFLDKPEITLVPEDWSADKDPVIEEISTDKFTAKISSSTQQGKWIWRARGPRRESNAGSQAGPSHSTANDKTTIKEVVLLIHGIRDFAEWQHKVSPILREIPEKEVWPLNYGRFDAVRFWFPIWTRDAPLNKLLWRIREAIRGMPAAQLSVIAHSFGTYAIGRILKENPDIRLHRLVLCGAVLPTDFRWDQIRSRVETDIINDCGIRDIWPVLAQSTTFGYGPSGRFGFGTPGVRDRFHNFGHGGFFEEKFVREFWLPWFRMGQLVNSEAPPPSGTRWHLLTIIQIKWLAILLCVLTIFGIYWLESGRFGASRDNFSMPIQKDDAEGVSKKFLSLLDNGRYSESWEMFNKGYLSQQSWVNQCKKNQDEHGDLKERKPTPRDISFPRDLPNSPGGQYATLIYDSTFENFPEATETVILMLNSDGHWKIWNYQWEAPNPSPTPTVTTPTPTATQNSQSRNVPAAYDTGSAYFQSRQYDLAISEFNIAETENPIFAMTYSMRGLCWYFRQNYPKAISDFTRFIELEPSNKSGFWQRGLCFFDTKDFKNAISDFSQTIAIDPKDGSAYYQRGLSYLALQDIKQAVAELTKAILVDDGHILARFERAKLYIKSQQYSDAIPDLERVVEYETKHNDQHQILRCRDKSGNAAALDGPLKDFVPRIPVDQKKRPTISLFAEL